MFIIFLVCMHILYVLCLYVAYLANKFIDTEGLCITDSLHEWAWGEAFNVFGLQDDC